MLMPTKLGRVAIYNKELLSIRSQGPLIRWSFRSHEQLNLLYFYYHKAYGHQTWESGDLLWETFTHKFTNPVNTWSREVTWEIKKHISTTTIPMTIELGRVVTYNEELPLQSLKIPCSRGLVSSRDKLNMQINMHIKYPQALWPLNLAWWKVTIRGFHRYSHTTL